MPVIPIIRQVDSGYGIFVRDEEFQRTLEEMDKENPLQRILIAHNLAAKIINDHGHSPVLHQEVYTWIVKQWFHMHDHKEVVK